MNRSFLYGFLCALVLFATFGSLLTRKSEAQARLFDGVVPFWTTGGWLGLFNQNDGMVYFYDDKVETCIQRARLTGLGQAFMKVDQ